VMTASSTKTLVNSLQTIRCNIPEVICIFSKFLRPAGVRDWPQGNAFLGPSGCSSWIITFWLSMVFFIISKSDPPRNRARKYNGQVACNIL
jgi:hypothetical protein